MTKAAEYCSSTTATGPDELEKGINVMKILVLDIAASKTGALSVLKDFYSYIKESGGGSAGNDSPVYWTFVTGVPGILDPVPERNIDVIVRDDVKRSSKARLAFELLNGGSFVNSLSPDIVFSLENMLPRGIRSGIEQVLYIHQPVGFQHEKKFSVIKKNEREQGIYQRFYHPLIIASAKRADRIVVQTEWMRKALINDEKIRADIIYKVPPDIPDLSGYVKKGEFDSGRFFFPASDLPYKNHAVIEAAKEILAREGYEPEVMYTKKKVYPREEIFAEYNRSTLLFPSYLETYGMPLGEARQFGNPILAADTVFSREVLEGYDNAYFFDAFDAGALAGLMRSVMDGGIVPAVPQRAEGKVNSYSELEAVIAGRSKQHG